MIPLAREIDRVATAHVARKAYKQKILISSVALVLFSIMLVLLTIFATGSLSERKGMFEIVSQNGKNGKISLSNTADFAEPTTRLECVALEDMTNISGKRDIPQDIEGIDGPHNGESYFAHTFYLRNVGETKIDVEERVNIVGTYKGAEKAIRVKVYRNGADVTYAAPSADGEPEHGTVAFLDDSTAYVNTLSELEPQETVKYTVVVWLEGDDPECLDDIKGGFVKFAMNYKVINGSDKQADNKE